MPKNNNYRITRNQIEPWLADANERTCRIILWVHAYASKHDLSFDEIGRLIRQPNGKIYAGDSIYQSLTGRRNEAQLSRFLDAAESFIKVERERSTITRAGFVETNLTKKIFSILEAARNFGKTMFIIGRSHIGKTTALREWARISNEQNLGSATYLRAPAGGSKSRTLYRLCQARGLSTGGNDYSKEMDLIDSFNPSDVLIIDEAHQYLSGKIGLRTIEYLRELADLSGCGNVWSATEVFEQALLKDPATKKLLGQLKMRSLIHAKLPDRPTKQNLTQFAKHFGLPPAKDEALDLQTEIIRSDSLGRWLSILEGASRIAAKENNPLTWEHALQSHAALVDLAQGD